MLAVLDSDIYHGTVVPCRRMKVPSLCELFYEFRESYRKSRISEESRIGGNAQRRLINSPRFLNLGAELAKDICSIPNGIGSNPVGVYQFCFKPKIPGFKNPGLMIKPR